MAAACRSAEEAASSLELRLAQAESDAAAAVLGQQQAQARRRNTIIVVPCSIKPTTKEYMYQYMPTVCRCAVFCTSIAPEGRRTGNSEGHTVCVF